VAVAAVLMTATGIVHLVDGIAVVAAADAYLGRVRAAVVASGVSPEAFELGKPIVTAMPYVVALILGVVALCLLGLAGAVYAGRQVGRILAWIAIGLFLTGHLYALSLSRTPSYSGIAVVSVYSRNESGTRTFAHSLWTDYPALYRHVSFGLATFAMLALIAVVALLAQPSANGFIRVATTVPKATSPDDAQRFTEALAAESGATEEQLTALSRVVRQYLDGELTDEDFAEARRPLLGQIADGDELTSRIRPTGHSGGATSA
jgi:hypothetical protein